MPEEGPSKEDRVKQAALKVSLLSRRTAGWRLPLGMACNRFCACHCSASCVLRTQFAACVLCCAGHGGTAGEGGAGFQGTDGGSPGVSKACDLQVDVG